MQARTRLRHAPPPFIGRESACARAEAALAEGRRLVTLLGPGGIGKTRLAQEIAERAAGRFPGGVAWVDLIEARSVDDLASAIGIALDVRTTGATARRLSRLADALTGRGATLVVLDDFDHLVADAAEAISSLCRDAGNVTFVVTSRERLRLSIETCLFVDALDLRARNAGGASEAVDFFVACAKSASPSFALREDEVQRIARMVAHLEGIPRAIELCAAQTASLSLRTVEARLLGEASGPRRAATGDALLRTLDWSWSLLEPHLREALARFSMFHGGFSFEAAAAMLGGDEATALSALTALHDRSLIRAIDVDDLPGERRLHLFESARAFAEERMDELGLRGDVERAHTEYFTKVGPAWADAVDRAGGLAPRARLALDVENLLAVGERARRATTNDTCDDGLAAVLALDPLVGHPRFPLSRVTDLVTQLLAAERGGGGRRAPAARLLLGRIALLEGRFDDIERLFSEARDAARAHRDADVEALSLVYSAAAAVMRDDLAAGDSALDAAEKVLDQGDPSRRSAAHARAMLHGWRGEAFARREDPRRAAEQYHAALLLFRRHGDRVRVGMAEASLALSWLDLGLLDRAEQACSLAIEISHEARARRDECFALTTRGRVLAARGDFEEARRSMERAIELHRGLGDPWGQGHHELHLGEIELEAGHLDAACAALGRAEEYFAKTGDRRYATFAAAVLAAALASKDAVSLAEAAAARAGEGDHAPSSWEHAASFHLGHVDLARARAARARGAHDEERRHLDAAAARARRDVTESEQARLAARVLSRKMPERARAEDPTSGDVARAAADGSWLVLPDGQRLDLAGRPALKNIVAALLSARTERVGRSISPETLFAAGWPEEAARGVTAEKRVYVAVTRLRKLGLGAILVSRDDGFLFDPRIAWSLE